ncbi:hypothetical protein AGMMS49579_03320 [Spirochaetia bacterium]|nr:hypothetical protein AGMMS49579_03320 [Spirochaetia bacterium]
MSIKMKKRDLAIAFAFLALILVAVLTGLAACQNPGTGLYLGAHETQTLNTGPTTNGGYGPAPNPNLNLTVPNFMTVPGGYTGPAIITYYNPDATFSVTITAAGLLEYPPSVTRPTGSIKSITLTDVNKTHLIGRPAQFGAPLIVLNLDTGGELHFRPAVSGSIPIGTYAEFQLINNTTSGALLGIYKQEADLDLMGGQQGVPDWTPVGTNRMMFSGTYDGGGKKLMRLQINKPDSAEPVGLFCRVTGVLKNIGIESGTVTGGGYCTGGVTGESVGPITACYNRAAVTGKSYVGGVAGLSTGGITACYNTAAVTGTEYVGGVAGSSRTMTASYNSGAVTGNYYLGGVAGIISFETITACYNTAAVTGYGYLGGVAGRSNGDITACYNTGTVVANSFYGKQVGGVAGELYSTGTITASYNSGALTGKSGYVGGVAGVNHGGSLLYCYWKGVGTQPVGEASGSTSNSFGAHFSPGSSGEWGTGNGSGSGRYWMAGTTNGGQLPRLWFE